MPGLYGLGNANVTTSVTNTTGLYQQSGAVEILNGAEQLLTLLSNNGTVEFQLDPTTGNTKVEAFANGTGTYGNSNVATFLSSGTDTQNIITTANVSGAYILGNISQATGLPSATVTLTGNVTGSGSTGSSINTLIAASGVTAGTYGNATTFPTFTVGADGRVTSASFVTLAGTTVVQGTANQVNVSAVGSTYTISLPTNLIAPGNISTSSNVSGAYLLGNGSAITGLSTTQVAEGTNLYFTNARARTAISVTSNSGTYSDSNVQYNNTTGVITYNEPSWVENSNTLIFPIKNTSGGPLTKGTPVYATGTVGATDVIEVSASRADTASTMPAIGLLSQDLANNGTGWAVQLGLLSGYNTNSYTLGQTLYVSATGGITGTRPNNGYLVEPIGTVGRVNASTGIIVVNIWNYFQAPNLGSGNVWIGNANSIPTETVFSTAANSAIATYLPTYTGAITSLTGNVTTTANVQANYFLGNGAFLTGIATSTYGNTNVSAYLASGTDSANIITSANVSGGNILATNGLYGTIQTTAQPNINSLGTLVGLNILGNLTVYGTGKGLITANTIISNTTGTFGGTISTTAGNIEATGTGQYGKFNFAGITNSIYAGYGTGNQIAIGYGSGTTGAFNYWDQGGSGYTGITLQANGVIAANGNITTTGNFLGNASALTYTTGASAGTYGNSTYVPVITVDSNHRITGITTTAAAGGGGSTGLSPFLLMGA